MSDIQLSISTRQASALLGVHESSIKRWCNTEELACSLTPGGHRRIPIGALVAFAQRQDILLPLRHFGEDAGRVWTGLTQAQRKDDFEPLAELTYAWIAQGWSHQPARLIEYLGQEGFSRGRIFDRLVGAVMRRVGQDYLQGELAIGDEHWMTQTMREVLVTLSVTGEPTINQNGSVKPVAVVGCLRREAHELGALMVRLALEAEGWRVVYLGPDVPTEEVAAQQRKHGAALVCLSIMPPMGMAETRTAISLLDRMYVPALPYRLAFGGSALSEPGALDRTGLQFPDVQCFNKIEPFMAWVRAFTP